MGKDLISYIYSEPPMLPILATCKATLAPTLNRQILVSRHATKKGIEVLNKKNQITIFLISY